MGILWERDIEIAQGEDYSNFWGYASGQIGSTTNPPTAYPTPASAVFTISESADQDSSTLLTLTSGGGGITFTNQTIQTVPFMLINVAIPNATTGGLPAGTWFYSLFVMVGGLKYPYACGSCVVLPTGPEGA